MLIGPVNLPPNDHGVAARVQRHLGVECTLSVRADVVREVGGIAPRTVAVFAAEDLTTRAVGLPPNDHGVAVFVQRHLRGGGVLTVRADVVRKTGGIAPRAVAVFAAEDLKVRAVGLIPDDHRVAARVQRHLGLKCGLSVRADVVRETGGIAPRAVAVFAAEDLIVHAVGLIPDDHRVAARVQRHLGRACVLPRWR